MDKKKSIIEFLINCLEIRNSQYRESIDNAFYQRSLLIEDYSKENENGDKIYKIMDKLQEEEIKKLIYIFENIKEDQLGTCLLNNPELITKYLNYLCDGQESSKKKLLELFKKKTL
ncbi:hypothetical protein NBO_70g0005 [Nosema bombycis CQ1]|uniref:Uncharacterized protein n=1 Tax=Nosema bombycis (strain CQ1 / CVCC 102059) TaxID=578461 RepID=R0KTE4_NOSB1|nr:hypothetical protein NBO_70g0005 [Nosema bombycis CQ1]|eukprot:EOB13497.1 hypothetical protein NBO_70g0005 [Nosema bombycis CQ1]